jgi:hypothetical protein
MWAILGVKDDVLLSTPFNIGAERRTSLTLNDVEGIYSKVLCSSLASGLQGCEAVAANYNSHPQGDG